MDRFRRALNEPETLLLASGYSFNDPHIDELIFEAAIRHPRSEYVVFCHSTIPEQLAKTAETTPSLSVLTKDRGDPRDPARQVAEPKRTTRARK